MRKKPWYDATVETNFKGPYFFTDGNVFALEKQLMLKPQNWIESTNQHNLLCFSNDFDLQEWFHVVKNHSIKWHAKQTRIRRVLLLLYMLDLLALIVPEN